MLKFLYQTTLGRMALKILTRPEISKISGNFLDSKWSKCLIPYFMKKNHIVRSQFLEEEYTCFNDCFCRKIRPEKRPIDQREDVFIAPCDGLLSAYPIQNDFVVPVKASRYHISDLLRSRKLAQEFDGGICLVFRLCVNHYHRYCYPDSGYKSDNYFLPGVLHTVRPIALREVPVFTENSREYTILESEHFGKMIQMEVGAMMVGKIDNYHQKGRFEKGQEKGKFLYGGSTIIVLIQKDRVWLPDALFEASKKQKEINVYMGQKIGFASKNLKVTN